MNKNLIKVYESDASGLNQIASLSERFAVRTASPVRSLRCQTDLIVGGGL